MIKCPNCYRSNDEIDDECAYCGHILPKKRYCHNCNETYSYCEKFCIICGASLREKPAYNDSIAFDEIDKNRKYCPGCGRQVHKLTISCPICDYKMDYINSSELIRKKLKNNKNNSVYRPRMHVSRITLNEIADDYCSFEDYDGWVFRDGKFIFISQGVRDIEYDILDKEDLIRWYNK